MKLHPRHELRQKAEVEAQLKLLGIIKKYDLSYGEIFTILAKLMSNWARYLKKDEDKK
ncbi:hypothetical protein LCGC14_2453790 [marine sediment metagenome]|uniref:Uncharacterized protein n=1 Tax=marine sediment metagenome TaxID=412755 RepID=A0A0F9BFS6_9ZZZZ